jgi:integrase
MELVQPIRDLKVIEEFKKRLKGRDRFLFVLGINTGIRITDLLAMRVKDVRGRKYIDFREGKTGKQKVFLINSSLKAIIDEYTEGKHDEELLFPSRKGDKQISRVQAYRILNKVAEDLGLDEIGCHTLRKTFGYHYYQKTKDLVTLQEIFNHSAPSITRRYIGLNQDIMDKSLEDFSL